VLLTTTCVLCGRPGTSPCPGCVALLDPAPALPPPPGTERCVALLDHDGAAATLVAGVKYRNRRAAVPGVGRALAARAAAVGAGRASAVTWIPTTPARRRARGFDHARLLAAEVARSLDLPLRRLLARDAGPAQTGRSRAERWAGPRLRPVARVGGLVLMVDDVVTTGATASAAAGALRVAGAERVWVLAASRRSPQAQGGGGR
jgi:predicted amidophosphoribosyltransferase